jgi:hypothetical protein
MPRDVATRWNSTYDMLVFALEYRKVIDEISSDRDMRKYELDEEEWELVQQLCDVLAVHCVRFLIPCHRDSRFPSYSRTQPFSFRVQHRTLPL